MENKQISTSSGAVDVANRALVDVTNLPLAGGQKAGTATDSGKTTEPDTIASAPAAQHPASSPNFGLWASDTAKRCTDALPIATDPSFKPAAPRRNDRWIDAVTPVEMVRWTSIPRENHPTNGHGLWSYDVGGARRTRAPPIAEQYRSAPYLVSFITNKRYVVELGLEAEDGTDLRPDDDLVVLVPAPNQ